jgi:quinol-cytochrome oxidoreductase complex cytochrome b subunit
MTASDKPAMAPGGMEDWIERRVRARDLMGALLHVRIPADIKTFYLGGITLFMFAVQVVTGTLLALYYKPTPETAYDSVKAITSDVTFGWLIRSVHHWGANLMILFLILHLLRIFFQAAYKYPRELIWIVGAGLLLATIGFGFTGYLLPWDQRAFWATTVGTEIAGSVPGIGDALLQLLRGGTDVTDATLTRFFGIHVLVMPLLLAVLLAVHLTLVHQLGLASPSHAQRPTDTPATHADEKLMPFFPDYILDELIVWFVMLALLVCLASVFPAGLDDKADALSTPAHIKPEWYFLFLYEVLKHVPRIVGVITPAIALAVVALLPFLDRNPEVRARRRPLAMLLGIVCVAGIIGLTIWGYYS